MAFAPVKGDRPEWAVQKLAELGVDRIVVLDTERGVVRWSGPRAESHRTRLEKVVRAAVMQSRQVWLPEVGGPVRVAPFLAGEGPRGGVALAQMGGPPPGPGLRTVLVGPEGGWSPAELERAPAVVGLGASVLRAETAAVAAGVILTALRSGMVAPAGAPPGADG